MEELLKQIEKALENKLYLIALQSAVTLPDICSGLLNEDGKSVKKEYFEWYDKNVNDKQNLSGENCYYFRCALLHEGKMEHEKLGFSKIIFLEPNPIITCKGNIFDINGERVLNIDVESFCKEMVNSTKKWWEKNKNNSIVKRNYDRMIKYHKSGLAPFIVGLPVIA